MVVGDAVLKKRAKAEDSWNTEHVTSCTLFLAFIAPVFRRVSSPFHVYPFFTAITFRYFVMTIFLLLSTLIFMLIHFAVCTYVTSNFKTPFMKNIAPCIAHHFLSDALTS
jgi:hypothetical protein